MVRINNMDTTAFQKVEAPTPISTSNTNVLATSGFVRTWLQSQNLVINAVLSYVIDGVKTIFKISTNNVYSLTGALDPPMTIGNSSATSVNVLSNLSPAGKLQMLGTTQALKPAGTVGYSLPLVTNNPNTSKYFCGLINIIGGGVGVATTVLFPVGTPFSALCVPIIIACSLNTNATTVILSQPVGVSPHLGFGASFNIATTRQIIYIAIGY